MTSAPPPRSCEATAPGATTPPFTLFTADSHFATATAPELRVGGVADAAADDRRRRELFAPAHRRQHCRAIRKPPAQELPGEELQQYIFDGGLSWQLPIHIGRRLAPFVMGGAGYLRQLHEDRTLGRDRADLLCRWRRPLSGCAVGTTTRGQSACAASSGSTCAASGIDFEDKMRTYPTFSVLAVHWHSDFLAVNKSSDRQPYRRRTSPSSSSVYRRAAADRRVLRDVSIADRSRGDRCAGRTQRLRQDHAAAPHQPAERARRRQRDRSWQAGKRLGSDRAAPPDRLRDPGRGPVSPHDGGVEYRARAAAADVAG